MAHHQEGDKAQIVKMKKPSSKTHWASIYVAAGLSFVGSVQFSLYFSSLWPYMRLVGFLSGNLGMVFCL
jgi:hypothetical protein